MVLKRLPLLLKKEGEQFGSLGNTTIHQAWNVHDHEVALVSSYRFFPWSAGWWRRMLYRIASTSSSLFGSPNKRDYILGSPTSIYLICECSFDDTCNEEHCFAQKAVQKQVVRETKEMHGKTWEHMGLEKAILDIHRLSREGKWMGERWTGILYIHHVAELLNVDPKQIWEACDTLFSEERLDLNGAVLTRYKSRFRFPKEIQALFRYIIEEPLGWPNGNAGDEFVWELEAAIGDHTRFQHGKQAFWEHNYPYLSTDILLMFGNMWLQLALSRPNILPKEEAYEGHRKNEEQYLERLANALEWYAKELRDLCRNNKTGE